MKTVVHGGHQIEIPGGHIIGKEEVRYDGRVVSSKYSMAGAMHTFQVREDGEEVRYDVELGTRWHGFTCWAVVRRNGVIIYSDK